MRKSIFGLLLVPALWLTGCGKDEPVQPAPEPVPTIGTYVYDNQEYGIVQGFYSEDNYSYEFIFSPDEGKKLSTYCNFALKKHFAGQEFVPQDYGHNSDYMFVYEDPIHFYTRFMKISGRVLVVHKGDGNFQLDMDVTLQDGKKFVLNFDGKFTLVP